MTPHRRRLLLTTASLLSAPWMLTACERSGGAAAPVSFQGVDITGAEYARTLDLPDADGKPRSLAEFKGKVVVVFFGYVQCPDVCPTTLAELAAVKQALGADGQRIQALFVTIDPARDTGEVLKAYVASFGSDFVALRGSEEQLKQAAREFKVFYAKVPGKAEGSYTMDHTAGAYLFDTQGRVRVFSRYGSGAPALTNDLKALLAQAG
jgi:protein SCO1/2